MTNHFAVYKHNFTIKDNLLVTRQFIVLKSEDGSMAFTHFHRYIKSPRNRVLKYTNDGNTRFVFIAQFLNFLFFQIGIEKLDDTDGKMVNEFLNAYAMCNLPGDNENVKRTKNTVNRCVIAVIDFLDMLKSDRKHKCKYKKDDIYKFVNKRDKNGKVIKVKVPAFDVTYLGQTKKAIYRDMPNKAFGMLFDHIASNHTEILALVMLSAFAGLRPSEACNVRREDSYLGAGISMQIIDGDVIKIEIDIESELNLRSDSKSVGKIKKERKQQVPDIFLSVFFQTYNTYINYIKDKKYEKDYGALTVNKQGKAMTYDSYRKKLQAIVHGEMIPIYLSSDDPEIVLYGRILMENKLSPQIFRHWYTVQLVLSGIQDPGTLMYWRGDTAPESALTYLQNKGELDKQYKKINSETFSYVLWAAGKNYD